MNRSTIIALTVAWLTAIPAAAQPSTADKTPVYKVDAFGLCIVPHDLSRVPPASRAKVKDFWDRVAGAHRRTQDQIITDYTADLQRQGLDKPAGLSAEQMAARKHILARAGSQLGQDRSAYKQERDALINALPPAEQDAASKFFTPVIVQIVPSCPKGFETDYLG